MNVNETFQQIASSLNSIGVRAPTDPCFTVNEIIDITGEYLDTMEIELLEELLQRIASYNMYLKSQKGSVEARLGVLEEEYRRIMALEIIAANHPKYVARDEKEALALAANEELRNLHRQVIALRAQAIRLRDLPLAIDKKLDLIRWKYQRKLGEANECQFGKNHL